MTTRDDAIEQALRTILPPEHYAQIPSLAAILSALASGRSVQLPENTAAQAFVSLIDRLAGQQVATERAVVHFGAHNQLGDVTIQDVAGNNVIKNNLFVLIGLPHPPPAQPAWEGVDRVALRRAMKESFNTDELQGLCFDLGIDYEELPAGTKSILVQEMIRYCERRNTLPELARRVWAMRPHLRA